MSNTAMNLLATTILLALFGAGCTLGTTEPDLPLGRPVFGSKETSGNAALSRIELSARPPGTPAWNARLEKGLGGTWRIESRTDRSGETSDLADTKWVEHFLEVLGTFATEAKSDSGNDALFGLNPYRMEIRLGEPGSAKILRLGEPTGPNGIYFRLGTGPTKTWIGRGALTAFLPMLETPESLVEKSPFFAPIEAIQSLTLRKLEGADRGEWEFVHSGTRWLTGKIPLNDEKNELIERIVRQRLVRLLPPTENPDLAHPDWKITAHTASGEETLTVAFVLNEVFARNPARSDRAIALYPEAAGALRAFTQSRFTPRKSGKK